MSIEKAALAEISKETSAIRGRLDASLLADTVPEISLGSDLFLPRAYEAGNIAAVPYTLASLPAESELCQDLQRLIALYREAVPVRRAVIAADPTAYNVPAPPSPDDQEGVVFQPKNADDYIAWVKSHQQRRTRKHEALVKAFGEMAQSHGWLARTKGVHPRDLVLDCAEDHLLVEAKIIRANPESAVREAIGQLLAYEFVFYSALVTKVALFSAPIGDLWTDLLSRLSIASVWLDGPQWRAAGEPVAWINADEVG
jgi:hypothetical protein